MKKQSERLENESLNVDLSDVLKEVEQGLEMIENNVPVYTPNLEWFEHIVIEEKQKLRKKLIFDVATFAVVSLIILSGVLFALYKVPIVFFTIQGVVTVFFVAYFAIQYVKQVKET